MKQTLIAIAVFLLVLVIIGCVPFSPFRDTNGVLTDDYTEMETGIHRQANGIYVVKALTRMPDVKPRMVKWWFAEYMQTTEHYKRWHPTAHVWMDWENKKPGEIIGASHLVHEYIGQEFHKLRIQFVDPAEFIEHYQESDNQIAICARTGLLDEPMNLGSMCHVVRATAWGAEMRSIFWLGHVDRRNGNNQVLSIEGVLGNTALMRYLFISPEMATDLMIHAVEEMGYLADFLPELYLAIAPSTSPLVSDQRD